MTHGPRPGHRIPGRRPPRRTAGPGITGTMLTCRNPGRLARRRPARRRLARRDWPAGDRPAGGWPAGDRAAGDRARGALAAGSGPGRGRDQHARNARCPRMAGAPVAGSQRGAARPGRALAADGETEVAATMRRRRGRGGHSAPEPAYQDDLPPADGTHLFPAQAGSAGQDAGPAPLMESQDLWESWEPPYNQAGAAPEPVLNRTAAYPELVRDAEYEDELWQTPGLGGAGGDGPRYPGQHRRAAHARNAGRPRMNGAFLALAGALAVAGAIPLGILGVRTLHHGNALKTAPLSASSAAGAGQNGAATFTALAGPGCPAAANAAAIPYHAPDGDGWHNGTASVGGPCGTAFTYSYLAMVPGNPGEWHDHYTWIFRTGMNNPSCSFSLYIPVAALGEFNRLLLVQRGRQQPGPPDRRLHHRSGHPPGPMGDQGPVHVPGRRGADRGHRPWRRVARGCGRGRAGPPPLLTGHAGRRRRGRPPQSADDGASVLLPAARDQCVAGRTYLVFPCLAAALSPVHA